MKNWVLQRGRFDSTPKTTSFTNNVSQEQISGFDLVAPKTNHLDQRKEMIKSKIKSRLSLLLASNRATQQKPPSGDWKKQSDFSLDEIIQRHTMRNLKRKYMDYLEKGKQQGERIRIGGAYNFQLPSEIHRSNLTLQGIRKAQILHSPHRLTKVRTPRKPPNFNPQQPNLQNMQNSLACRFQTCRVSPMKLEKRPLTAGNGYTEGFKMTPLSAVGKNRKSSAHYRHSSEVATGYFFGQLRKKRQSVNLHTMSKHEKSVEHPSEFLELKPWEIFDDFQKQ